MENLKVIENELVPVYETSEGEKVVYGSELHKVLGVKSRYNDWIRNRIKDCDAQESLDYQVTREIVTGNPNPKIDHIILLDTAKEMAMLERNDKGKKVRRYFIDIEKKYKKEKENEKNQELTIEGILNNPDYAIKLLIEYKETKQKAMELEEKNAVLTEVNEVQAQQIAEMNPKVSYYDEVLSCVDALPITIIAKDYGWTPQQMNKFLNESGVQYTCGNTWVLYKEYQDKGYTKTETFWYKGHNGKNLSNVHTKWTQKGRLFIYELMKQSGNLPLIEQ